MVKFEKTKKERFPRKLKKEIRKSMSAKAYQAMIGCNNDFFNN